MKKIIYILLFVITQSCVQQTHEKVITFQVDMSAIETIKNVGVRGNFTNPSWEQTIPLTDDNNDGIYEATFQKKTAVFAIEFKFVHQDTYELKDQPNRSIQFEYKPETITYSAVFDVPNKK